MPIRDPRHHRHPRISRTPRCGLRAVLADERSSSWEDDSPTFRVYLHELGDDGRPETTSVYDVAGADLLQTIDWAQREAGGTLAWAIALLTERPDWSGAPRQGLVWLVGMDGIDTPADESEVDRHGRMMRRVAARVEVPAFDHPSWRPGPDARPREHGIGRADAPHRATATRP